MIKGFLYKFNRSFKNLKNVIFHVKLLSPTLKRVAVDPQNRPKLFVSEGTASDSREFLVSEVCFPSSIQRDLAFKKPLFKNKSKSLSYTMKAFLC